MDLTPLGIVITTLANRYIEKSTLMLQEIQMKVTLAWVVLYADGLGALQPKKQGVKANGEGGGAQWRAVAVLDLLPGNWIDLS